MTRLTPEIHWTDDLRMAKLSFRLQFFSVKRTGLARVINLTIHLVALPLYLFNGAVSLVFLAFLSMGVLSKRLYLRTLGKSTESSVAEMAKFAPLVKYLDYSPAKPLTSLVERFRARFDNRPFVLYLRPFRMDNRLAVLPFDAPLEIEVLIRNGAKRLGPMIALGDTNQELSNKATRIRTTDSAWRSEIAHLLAKCGYIIVVPENTDGTLWELNEILTNRNYLSKTVFLNINSAGRDHPYWGRERRVYCEDDGKTFLHVLETVVGDQDIDIPPLDQIVCAFLVGNALNLICARTLVDPGLWGFSATSAIYLMLESRAQHFESTAS
jgi:hypothetical protein